MPAFLLDFSSLMEPAAVARWLEAAPWGALLGLWGGYAVIVLTPGPNMLAVGGLAALQGFRRTLPLILGVVAGSSAQVIAVVTGLSLLAPGRWGEVGSLFSAVLLLLVAWQVWVRSRRVVSPELRIAAGPWLCLTTGVLTGLTNPITLAGVAAQLLGRSEGLLGTAWGVVAALGVGAIALVKGIVVANVFAMSAAQRLALAWQRPVGAAVAVVLVVMAANVTRPLVPVVLARVGTTSGSTGGVASADPTPWRAELLAEMTRHGNEQSAAVARLTGEIGLLREALRQREDRVAALEHRLARLESLDEHSPARSERVPSPPSAAAAPDRARAEQKALDCPETVQATGGARFSLPFDRRQRVLTDEQRRRLDEIANVALVCDARSMLIDSHTDNRGSNDLNERLSRERGLEIADYLQRRSGRAFSVEVSSHGARGAIAPNDTEQGRARNRRAEITIRAPEGSGR